MNLSQLIQEAIERFEKEFCRETGLQDFPNFGETVVKEGIRASLVTDFLKTELETIVKESFKNTRVEEKPTESRYHTADIRMIDSTQIGLEQNKGFNSALSDKYNKENYFLKN